MSELRVSAMSAFNTLKCLYTTEIFKHIGLGYQSDITTFCKTVIFSNHQAEFS